MGQIVLFFTQIKCRGK